MLKSSLRSAFYAYAPTALTRRRMIGCFEREVAVLGEAELAELHHFVGPGDVVLDIGANHGTYSWLASHLGAQVIAFEPYVVALQRLRNIASPSIEVREIAVSNKSGAARLHMAMDDDGLGTLRADGEIGDGSDVAVTTATLDSMNFAKVSFIKIDVEGHEDAVIEGGMNTIDRHQPLLLVEIEDRHNTGALTRLPDLMTGLGYRIWFFRDGDWRNFAEFDRDRDQDSRRLAELNPRNRRSIGYYNNFLFTPPGYASARIH